MGFIPRLLIVDDDESALRGLLAMLPRDRYVSELVRSADDGLKKMRQWTYDVVIVDVSLGGLTLLDRLRRERPSLPVILVTATGTLQQGVDAIRRGAFHYLGKPCDDAELKATIDGAIAARRRAPAGAMDGFGLLPMQQASRQKADANVELVGSGPAMSRLAMTIELVAASDAPVLVTGESGTGKELVARAIHARSARQSRPFVAVTSSTISEDQLEAELFGHPRSAGGTAQARKGLLAAAAGGTLFLDEIGDMPLGLQAKIVRVLQMGEARPLAGDSAQSLDVRVIAATHRDLPALVREGRFREDLFFRLDVLPVVVPPLRERREDIPALVEHLLASAQQRSPGSPVKSIAPDALEIIESARWPGNVRELAGVIERLVVLGRDERVAAGDLSFLTPAPHPAIPILANAPGEAPWTLKRVTQVYTEHVLSQTGGNKQLAAAILDVDLSTLYRWERAQKRESLEAGPDGDKPVARARKPRGASKRGSMIPPP